MSTRDDQVSRYWLTPKGYAALLGIPIVVDEDESGDDE